MEIDHIFIFTKEKAPEGDLLLDFGLIEGSTNYHKGQGTANRRFFFSNFMLELLWVENSDEINNEKTKPTKLYQRSKKATNVSPFGLVFRPSENNETINYSSWNYNPDYLPNYLDIKVSNESALKEPIYFYLSFATQQDKNYKIKTEPMRHLLPLKKLSSIDVITNNHKLSTTSNIINELENISIINGIENLIRLTFDNGINNKTKDFRPDLPLIINW